MNSSPKVCHNVRWSVYKLFGAHVSSVCFSVQESMAHEQTDIEEHASVGEL